MSEFDLVKFKRDLRNTIIQVYKQKGYAHAEASITNLITSSNKKAKEIKQPDLAIQIRGECCEILLEIGIWEFIKQNKLPWIITKGLCLERTDKKKNRTTELDFTLFTPGKIVLFESKYRQGDITLNDICTLVPAWGNVTDVYKQNIMHLVNLKDHFANCILTMQGVKPFALVLYVESVMRVKDVRTADSKRIMRLVGKETLFAYLTEIKNIPVKVWDMKKVSETITMLDSKSSANLERHMKEVAKC